MEWERPSYKASSGEEVLKLRTHAEVDSPIVLKQAQQLLRYWYRPSATQAD